jgi:spore germination protein GerM
LRAARKSTLLLTSLKVLIFATAVGAGGYVGMQAITTNKPGPVKVKPKPVASVRRVWNTPSQTRFVDVYMVRVSGGEATLSPVPHSVTRTADPKRAAITRLLSVSAEGGDSAGLIPRGTKLLTLSVDRGLATVDLSREFLANFHGGSLQESLTLEAITRTLIQFSDVKSVRILVEGRTIDALGGHFDLSQPLSYKSGHLTAGGRD